MKNCKFNIKNIKYRPRPRLKPVGYKIYKHKPYLPGSRVGSEYILWTELEGGIQHGRVFGFGNYGKQLLHLNSSKTPMHIPTITNLDDIVQLQQMKDSHAQELNVMKEENDKLRAESCKLCKRLRVTLMEIQSSSGCVRMEHHTVNSHDDDDDQSEEENI
ncbi:hypothetical protein M9H77_31402 [Catharanthus roseus]|uniref:Uncharacterized protein n=1 Tax=Catharanthus roseus TaxID=4058 RepID=A0ACC0A1T7_CATRO|nr:hypothetical protein M9H77_31402 [Catharanthus roseus]